MNKTFLFLFILILVTAACEVPPAAPTPDNPVVLPTGTVDNIAKNTPTETLVEVTKVPLATTAEPVPTEPAPTPEGVIVSYGPVSLVLPAGLAGGISGSQLPRAEGVDIPPWEITPGHTQIEMTEYALQGKLHQPRIYVFPAQDYAKMLPAAFERIHRLDNILYSPGGPDLDQPLPMVPFFNAAQVFASNLQQISFQNGGGVRFLTQYDQYYAPINNQELFYQFQGVTRDGTYYIIAIFPITSPVLAGNSELGAALPAGGVVYPDINDPDADFQGYYAAISELLDNASPDAFTPTISQLDELIQSLLVASGAVIFHIIFTGMSLTSS